MQCDVFNVPQSMQLSWEPYHIDSLHSSRILKSIFPYSSTYLTSQKSLKCSKLRAKSGFLYDKFCVLRGTIQWTFCILKTNVSVRHSQC